MLKLTITLTILLATLFTPITPAPAVVYFAPNTPIDTALNLTDHLDGEQFSTTWIDAQGKRWYTARQWHNRHPGNNITQYHPGETITRIELNQLSTPDASQLQSNPLITNIDYIPPYLVNLSFFFRQLQKITGPL